MDKQKIKSVPRLTTDNPVDNFQTALNFTDVSEDGWVWLRQQAGSHRRAEGAGEAEDHPREDRGHFDRQKVKAPVGRKKSGGGSQ